MTKEEYQNSLKKIESSNLNPENKQRAVMLLKKRAYREYMAQKADASGFSYADRINAEQARQRAEKEAIKYGLPEYIAHTWEIGKLNRYLDFKRPRKVVYDESELA